MSSTNTQRLREAYHLATLRLETARITDSAQHAQIRETREKFAKLYEKEVNSFRSEYLTRVEMAHKRLIDEAGSYTKEFKPRWSSNNKFDKAALLRQAQREVSGHHRVQMDLIEKRETSELETLLSHCEPEKGRSIQPKHDFNKATNRRSDVERRQPSSRRQTR